MKRSLVYFCVLLESAPTVKPPSKNWPVGSWQLGHLLKGHEIKPTGPRAH